MRFYHSPAEMYDARADRFQREGNRHWALAKNGDGDHHYGQARNKYSEAANNREKASLARATNATFRNGK